MKSLLSLFLLFSSSACFAQIIATDVMNARVMHVGPEDNLEKVSNIMIEGGYDSVPVLSNNILTGIVSSTNLLKQTTKSKNWAFTKVQDANITESAKTVKPDEVLDLMHFDKVVFVVDKKGALLGVIAPQDILSRELTKSRQSYFNMP